MARALPLRPSIDHEPRAATVAAIGDDDAHSVLDALASETARALLDALADAPATASDLADGIDTSLQNAQYHLDNLRDAGLVTDAGTWYSAKGKEMTVYAVATQRIELDLDAAPPTDAATGDPVPAASPARLPLKGD